MSVQKSNNALSPNSNRNPLPSANAPLRTVRQSWKIHSALTSVGAPSILDIAIAHPRSHSSAVHLVRRLTMMRLFLITAPLPNSKQWTYGRLLTAHDSFSIEEVLYYFYAISQLCSSRLGHRKDSATRFARFKIGECRNTLRLP
jgi:hypothetical protein